VEKSLSLEQKSKGLSLPEFGDSPLIAPYGGSLVDLTVPPQAAEGLKAYASQLPSIQLSSRSVCDLELLATGALSPLDRFMGREDHQRVLDEMRLAGGEFFPLPVALPVDAGPDLHLDRDIALRNHENELLAVMTIAEIYTWDRGEVADRILGTRDGRHPPAAEQQRRGGLNIAGPVQILNLPRHFDFPALRRTPSQTRAILAGLGRQNVVAYPPPEPLLPVDVAFIQELIAAREAVLLVQLAASPARLGDLEYYNRIRFYRTLAGRCFQPDQVVLALLPLAARLAGPRQALLQALICRNLGANHMILSLDQAGSAAAPERGSLREPGAVQELVEKHSRELGVEIVLEQGQAEEVSPSSTGGRFPDGGRSAPFRCGQREVAGLLANFSQSRQRRGVCLWFTGLSGAGKSTTAEMLTWLILENGRQVTVLDGDVVRTHLSKGLGFSKEDRDTNVRRIGFVAAELVRLGGIVICAVVSPYQAARQDVRHMVGADQFVEIYVATPLEVCEARDVKGMYARARRGGLNGFTGIDDPYEPPDRPEIILDTIRATPQDNARAILAYLAGQGFIEISHEQDLYETVE
jgi:sulfate adenylyltransferase